MIHRHRGSTGGDHALDSDAMQGDQIEITLDYHHASGSPNRLECVGKAVEGLTFAKKRALGGIEVFRLLIRAQRATAEGHHPPADVSNRKYHASPQPVVVPAGVSGRE